MRDSLVCTEADVTEQEQTFPYLQSHSIKDVIPYVLQVLWLLTGNKLDGVSGTKTEML